MESTICPRFMCCSWCRTQNCRATRRCCGEDEHPCKQVGRLRASGEARCQHAFEAHIRAWVPCSRSTAVRDDSLASHMGARMVRERISFQGACPTSPSGGRNQCLCSSKFSLPCFDCRHREHSVDTLSAETRRSVTAEGRSSVLAIDGTSRGARTRVQVVEVSRLHRSTDGAIILARIRASAPPAHHKAAGWSTQPHISAANADILSPVVVRRANTSRTGSYSPASKACVLAPLVHAHWAGLHVIELA